jgi:hypothetical protein
LQSSPYPAPALTTLRKVHAPNHIIAQLGGTFAPYATYAELPPTAKLVPPHLTSFAAAELRLYWTPSWSDGRKPSAARLAVIYTLMLLAVRKKAEGRAIGRANGGQLPSFMSSDMWLLVLGFLRHETYML